MTNAVHGQQSQAEGIHSGYTWVWADAAARTAQTGVTQAQVDSVCTGIQLDEDTVWRPTDTTPTWVQRGSGGAASNQHITDDTSNDIVIPGVEIIRRTSAAPLDGIGVSIDLIVEGGSGDDIAGQVAAGWQDKDAPDGTVVVVGSQGGVMRVIWAAGPPSTSGGSQPTLEEIITLLGPGSYIMSIVNEAAQIPTGTGMALVGGEDNKGSGNYGAVVGGRNNQNNTDNSVVSGRDAVSRFPASLAHSSGGLNASGDNLDHKFLMKVETNDNTPTALLTDSGGNIPFEDDTSFVITLDVVGRTPADETFTVFYRCWVKGYCSGGVATIADSDKEIESEGPAAVYDINFSTSGNEVIAEVEGHVTNQVLWTARVTVLEITGA